LVEDKVNGILGSEKLNKGLLLKLSVP